MQPKTKNYVVREFDNLNDKIDNRADLDDLQRFARENERDPENKYRPILEIQNTRLKAQNFVGVIQTRSGATLEILPKVDFYVNDDEKTREIFFDMLRTSHSAMRETESESHIRELPDFPMLEYFIRMFLKHLVRLTQRGLAKHYHSVEENLPRLKGRILFPQHIRFNAANRARFYVQYDEFSANRPANRLIRKTIDKLFAMTQRMENQQLLHQLKIAFGDIPPSANIHADWQAHRIDRTMRDYDPVMRWVRLFLFGDGLATFSGEHANLCLLFPMEKIFEDFVVYHLQRQQQTFSVQSQGPREPLATDHVGNKFFHMYPDITLQTGGKVMFVLDTKWKRIKKDYDYGKYNISQSDMYQLYAYGKKYACKKVALIYPHTNKFQSPLRFQFDANLHLTCFPFDVAEPEGSVAKIIAELAPPQTQAA